MTFKHSINRGKCCKYLLHVLISESFLNSFFCLFSCVFYTFYFLILILIVNVSLKKSRQLYIFQKLWQFHLFYLLYCDVWFGSTSTQNFKGSVLEKWKYPRIGLIRKKALLIASNITFICCLYKEKIVKDVSYRIT